MIRIQHLKKHYGPVQALQGLDLETRSGEVLALLGPNGAGKSTTIKTIVGLVRPDSGRVLLEGIDVSQEPRRARGMIGYLPQRVHFYDNLSPREVMAFFAQLRKANARAIDPLLERVGLAHAADRRTAGFSGGMLQRLGLAVALLGDPRLLILDEPTSGLDPEGAILFRDVIRERQQAGTTVLLSSHLLAEVESIADRVAVCSQGRIVALDTLDGLRRSLALPTRMLVRLSEADGAKEAVMAAGAHEAEWRDGILRVTLRYSDKARVIRALEARGLVIEDFRTEDPSLADMFMAILHAPLTPPQEVAR